MIDELALVLQEHKRKNNKLTKFVFHNASGKHLTPDNIVLKSIMNY